MFIWFWVRWWYGAGWVWAWRRAVIDRLAWCNSAFSLSRLAATWTAPYKQTAVGRVKGSIGVHIRAWVDRLVSRVIGFLVRTVLIFVGLLLCGLTLLSGLIFLLAWPFIPLSLPLGIILWIGGLGK